MRNLSQLVAWYQTIVEAKFFQSLIYQIIDTLNMRENITFKGTKIQLKC